MLTKPFTALLVRSCRTPCLQFIAVPWAMPASRGSDVLAIIRHCCFNRRLEATRVIVRRVKKIRLVDEVQGLLMTAVRREF